MQKPARLNKQKPKNKIQKTIEKINPYLPIIITIILIMILLLLCFKIGGNETAKVYNNPTLLKGV